MALMESYAISAKHGFFGRHPPVLANRPVCVIKGHNHRDLEKAYNAGVKAGNGTAEERDRYREMLDTWDKNELELQKEFLTLSDNPRFLVAVNGGHNVHMTDPGVIVDGIKWTLSNLDD
jgi:hypothetical protein